MTKNGVVTGGRGGRAVVVGVKFDAASSELLDWALVKVAEPGDTVIALHIITNGDDSSFVSLVKTFDSVLEAYEGFCKLKQIELKLKLCRGSCTRKVLVREAKLCHGSKVVVGVSKSCSHSSVSVAKYLARKLSKDCWVLAVDNGKVMFQKDGSSLKGKGNAHRNTLSSFFQMHKNTKVVNSWEEEEEEEEAELDRSNGRSLRQALVSSCLGNRFVCGDLSRSSSCNDDQYDNADEFHKSKMAIEPVKVPEDLTRFITMLVNELPEFRPGWPLLCRVASPDVLANVPRSYSFRQIPVAQWVLKLPSRTNSLVSSSTSEAKQLSTSLNNESLDGNDSMIVKGLHERFSTSCRSFKYKELVSATSSFCPDNFIGKGGSSRVYRGYLPNGREVAVKILKQTKGVLKDFVAEIDIITTLNHKNVISLLGYCFENNNLLLVYNYLSRGSLEENLHGNKKDPVAFRWNQRYKVAVGIAEALDYLHNKAPQLVIHRDVKSSNILLSDDFEPQLSDFGLAKWASVSTTQIICSDVAGTFGYLAPEYFMYGKMNDKIDVYAYGVVLLELLSGRKPVSSESPKARESLVMWAKPILDDRDYPQLLDQSLLNDNDGDQMERMALAATLCIRHNPQSRPEMGMVLNLLRGDVEMLKWAKEQVSNGLEDSKLLKDEKLKRSNLLQSHLNVAFLDMEEDESISMRSMEQGISVEDYLKGRESRSSSFN
ncbi:Protein kinase protein with adenine nucleotide alpha hydrolases-like domain [Raphanus sativus]|uniref:Protein kinase STUNTED isoform X2 n=1 Tax=Raphanus sativus TaxID=3726 RepID=A0A9W3CM93_RAPSA|nr:protein kinase STUNTED isoform X2 [Raphanus sativus]KAJ4872878.1 Protein kinase protein with adenine nucleotide alpha hydrolases-like domain [Raphanus sativus]